jgi:retron-type reverse transcriptase
MLFTSMSHGYQNIISIKNLCEAWIEFVRGKKSKKDVAEFSLDLTQKIFLLHEDLRTKRYRHGAYEAFSISDPKPRSIHKATVRDRLLHHAIYRQLYSYFDQKFIHDSYSCRYGKGTHRAMNRFRKFFWKVSKNNTKTCWVLKCDIKKFFANIDHQTLLSVVVKHDIDTDTLRLLEEVISSFNSGARGSGLPLGNLTSQLLVNIYMNEFDQFVKHKLKVKYYIRYADDFVIMHHDKGVLMEVLPKVRDFLDDSLKLSLHPDKISLKTASSGIDFLGWVHFSHHRVLRTTTKKRMFRRLRDTLNKPEVLQSYLGLLNNGDTKELRDQICL